MSPEFPKKFERGNRNNTAPVERRLPGMGDFVEVGSPILAGVAGTVHVGMDTGLIALKIQRAIGRQIYLISIILVVGVLAAIWFVNLAAKPLGDLLAYAVGLARHQEDRPDEKLLARDDEVGQLARLFFYFAEFVDAEGGRRVPPGSDS